MMVACMKSSTQSQFEPKVGQGTRELDVMTCIDICNMMQEESIDRAQYFVCFKDFSKFCHIFFLKEI